MEAVFSWNAADQTLLEETRKMVFYDVPNMRIIDFDVTFKALTKVTFGDTKEGFFAIRLAAGLEEPQKKSPPEPKRTGLMVDSEGKEGEKKIWGKRADVGGLFWRVEGRESRASRFWIIPKIPSIRLTGTPAATACSPRIFSASTIFITTSRATAA